MFYKSQLFFFHHIFFILILLLGRKERVCFLSLFIIINLLRVEKLCEVKQNIRLPVRKTCNIRRQNNCPACP